MKKLQEKFRQSAYNLRRFWYGLALHQRITITMIAILCLGLIISSVLTFYIFSYFITRQLGDRIFYHFGELPWNGGAPNSPRDSEKFLIEGPRGLDPSLRHIFIERTSADINSSLIFFFIITTLLITVLGGVIVYYTTKKAIIKVQAEHDKMVQFISDASHDLRTPLSVIIGFTQLLQKSELQNEQQKYLMKVSQNATRMENLVEDMLYLSRIDSQQPNLNSPRTEHFADFDLAAIIAEEVQNMQISSGRAIQVVIEPGILLKCNAAKVRRIVQNLLSNAVKYTAENVPITVRLARTGKFARLTVADYGDGVPVDKLAAIFDRFTVLDESRKSQGNGLGLAIVKELAQEMGGSVSAQQTDKVHQKGLSVEIVLPLA
jgi:signal transduction histidine kinase